MATFERDGISIHYEEYGAGFPVLIFAPGGMRSSIPLWERSPWDPIRALGNAYRVIAMDQRNAGQSRAPITRADGWHSYTDDHLALLDHLGIERCHLLGGCIGGSFCLGLVERASERVASAVLQQPIGLSADNRDAFYELFDSWATELRDRPDVDAEALPAMRERFYGGDFVFNVSREMVASCPVPLLVLRGDDLYHPSAISEEIVRLAPRAELVERWKQEPDTEAAVARVQEFFEQHAALPTGAS